MDRTRGKFMCIGGIKGPFFYPLTMLCPNKEHANSGNGVALVEGFMSGSLSMMCNSHPHCQSVKKLHVPTLTRHHAKQDFLEVWGLTPIGKCPVCHGGEVAWGHQNGGFILWCKDKARECFPKKLGQLEFEVVMMKMEEINEKE